MWAFVLLLVLGCSSSAEGSGEPVAGQPSAAGGTAGAPQGGVTSGGAGGQPSAGAEAGGVSGTGAGTGGAVGGSPTECKRVPDFEATCSGCDVSYYRCGDERAFWEAENGQQFECADARGQIPDCVKAHEAATAWAAACCQ